MNRGKNLSKEQVTTRQVEPHGVLPKGEPGATVQREDVQRLPLDELYLDEENPRLPQDLQHSSPQNIAEYIAEHGALRELAVSFADNGYFAHEPVLVVRRAPPADGWWVVEGNRRVTTLKILLGRIEVENFSPGDIHLSNQRRDQLAFVPCIEVSSRDEVHKFLGFRHIGGIQAWSPEAKCRYLLGEVEREAKIAQDDVFRVVARRVGIDPAAVRQAYLAFAILRDSQVRFAIDASTIFNHRKQRFGVWLRAMQSPQIREYIGAGSPQSYSELLTSLRALKKDNLREVIFDIGPPSGDPVLTDSRNVTEYARVLLHPEAREWKRKEHSLETARVIVSREALPDRIRRIAKQLDALTNEVSGLAGPDEEIELAIETVERSVRKLKGTARVLGKDN